jgi:spore coat protein U-like protein
VGGGVFRVACGVISVAAAALFALASSAQAADLEPASSQHLLIHGDVTQHCSISSPGNVNFGSLGNGGEQADLRFGLDCNIPFVMNVQAQYGALTNIDYPKGQGPYSGSLPYVLDFTIPARTPSASVITASLSSRDLIAGKSISSQGAIATEGMQVHVALGHAEGEAGLLAGNYGETITITMSSI